MLCFVFSALVVLLDQFFKRWIVLTLAINEEIDLIPGIMKLTHVNNSGASFSILEDQRWLLVGISFVACVLLIFILLRYNEGFWGTLGLSALLGGAAGNLFDRLLHGYVVDMFKPVFINFAIFNIADIFITLGGITFCVFFIISSIRGGRASTNNNDFEDDNYEEDFDAFDNEDEEGVRIYDRTSDSRAVTSRRLAAREASNSEESFEPQLKENTEEDIEQAFYEPGPELQEFFENMPDRQEYPDNGQEQQEQVYAGQPQEYNDTGQDSREDYIAEQDTREYYASEQASYEYIEPEPAPQFHYEPEPAPNLNKASASDALSALEAELSEEDLLIDYDIDALLREYGFEDKQN